MVSFLNRGTVIRLAVAQAMTVSAIVMSVALGAILGEILAPDKVLATLPIAVMIIGTAVASIPAALLMRITSRRAGFLLGALLGIAGSLLSAWALSVHSFTLFVLGHFLLGICQGFASYYRFAAAEASGQNDANAISFVVAGGIVAAFLGPWLGQWGRDWVAGQVFVGSYLAQAILSIIAMVMIIGLKTAEKLTEDAGQPRPLSKILKQPVLQASIFGSAIGYSVMVMAMTAAPLAMLGCGLPGTSVTPVIQWHVVGMFAPSFFTGSLVMRHGASRIMQIGFALLLGHVAIAISGNEFLHFLSALVFLGVGWNFVYIGGTTLLNQTYRPAEHLRVQAINEFAVFGLVVVTTLSASWFYANFGWVLLNLAVAPFLVVAFMASAEIRRYARTTAPITSAQHGVGLSITPGDNKQDGQFVVKCGPAVS